MKDDDGRSATTKDGRRRHRRIAEIAASFVFGVAIAAFFSWPIVTSENLGKPRGRNIPTEPPDEANRVRHPWGFSIVYPPNWKVHVNDEVSELLISGYPVTIIPSRSAAALGARCLGADKPDNLADSRPTRFQGLPAFESSHKRSGEDPRSDYHLTFERDGLWYTVWFSIGQDHFEVPEIIRLYLATFRIEPEREPAD